MVDSYIKNKANNLWMSVATPFTGVLTESKFLEKGILTPEEFVNAGEQLTQKCPTWKWMVGEEGQMSKHLPPEKQFLITKNVPCDKRIKDLKIYNEISERPIDDEEDGWVETSNPDAPKGGASAEIMDIDNIGDDANIVDGGEEEEAKECVDMDDADNIFEAQGDQVVDKEAIKSVRRYDLSISYDFYYQTPRLWLFGYSEDGQVLSKEEIFEDVMADYANKTVTFENHPHTT
jgi:ubiquitin-like-conjugating enzyme ATG3